MRAKNAIKSLRAPRLRADCGRENAAGRILPVPRWKAWNRGRSVTSSTVMRPSPPLRPTAWPTCFTAGGLPVRQCAAAACWAPSSTLKNPGRSALASCTIFWPAAPADWGVPPKLTGQATKIQKKRKNVVLSIPKPAQMLYNSNWKVKKLTFRPTKYKLSAKRTKKGCPV